MLKINKAIFLILVISFCFSQGRMNAFGIGHYYYNQGAKNAMDGVSELSPSFQNNISLSNPSTWHELKFTFLSLSYSGNVSSVNSLLLSNGYSGLSKAMWVVPIKSKSSFGVSLEPYSDQRVTLKDQDTLSFFAFDTSYNYARSFKRSGGLLLFKLGTSYKINKNISLGYSYNILFGSSRQNESLFFDGSSVVQSSRSRYNGIFNDLFLGISLLEDLKIFSMYRYTIQSLGAAFDEKHLYDDANDNGYHDYTPPYLDFPFPDSVSAYSNEFRIYDLHNPTGFKLALNKYFTSRALIAIEIGEIKDKAKNQTKLRLPINNWINLTKSYKLSFNYYPNRFSLKFFDKFLLHTGFVYYEHLLKSNLQKINELGLSFGIGFKFKPVGNQININYYFGTRKYSDISYNESIQQIQLGISLADIWFVKRRQK
tara:strand:+ start:1201 stop:2478 length:1278 start_codon:yes stop_codon:yes gene_type:complete